MSISPITCIVVICTLDFSSHLETLYTTSCLNNIETFLGVICIPICTSTLYIDIKSIRQTNAVFVLCMYSKSTERHTVQLCVFEASVYHTVPETANTYLKYKYVVKLFFVNF